MTVRALVVEDSGVSAKLIEMYLAAGAIPIRHRSVSRLSEALEYLGDNEVDVVLMDLGLPDSVGLEGLVEMRANTDCPVIVLSGDDDPETALRALRMGAQDYLVKGEFQPEELMKAIRYAMARTEAAIADREALKKSDTWDDPLSADCNLVRRAERRLSQRNTTEYRDHLLHRDRLAATGRLAASLAHELSNPLQAIHNSLEMILSFPFSKEEMREYVRMADEEIGRLVEMVGRILDFSRHPNGQFEKLDVNRVVSTVVKLAKKYLEHRHVVLQESLAPGIPPIEGNATMLGQVILNMVINGVEAMPEGGSLSLTTDSSDNGCVEIRVSDSGVGIPKEELPRIFEPFYSTKPEGTGLGLSISQSIVKQHYGEIQVESEMGEGTSFIVRLPVYQDNAGT